jgi:alkaline phosphatase
MRKLIFALASATILAGTASAATVYPIDRATILVGSPFDFKVEFDTVVKPEDVKVTVNGQAYETIFGKTAEFVAEEKGAEDKVLGSALVLRDLTIGTAGAYKIEVSASSETQSVNWFMKPSPSRRPGTSPS